MAAKNAAVAALLEPEEMGTFDDEVERVISHRFARHSRAPRKPLTVIRGGGAIEKGEGVCVHSTERRKLLGKLA